MRKYILLINMLIISSCLSAQNLKVCTDNKGRCGYADEQGEVVVKCKYELAFAFENGLGKVGKNGKYGFVTPAGKEILPVNYDEITLWGKDIYRIKNGAYYGLFSKEAGIIVKPKYSCISKLNCYGKALITLSGKNSEGRIINSKVGIIEADGNISIEPKYDKICELQPFTTYDITSIALIQPVSQLMHIGTMSKTEKTVADAVAKEMKKGGATQITTLKVGIHPNDTLVTEAEYVCCYKGKKTALVNKRGTEITPFMANCTYSIPTEGVCAFRSGTTQITTGYWDIDNKKKLAIGKNLKIKKKQMYVTPFTGDVALVTDIDLKNGTNSIYFINKRGEKVSDSYLNALYKGGYWVVMKPEDESVTKGDVTVAGVNWGVMDGNGKTVIEQRKYYNIIPHNDNGLFTVMNETGRYGVVDSQENIVVPFEYTQLGEPINGWYWAMRDGVKTGIIDEKGEEVVPFEFHNIFMNPDKECTNLWVRKEPNGLWSNFDIAKKEIVGDEVVSSSNFSDKYAWVVPKGQSLNFTSIHKALCILHNIEPDKASIHFGILIDKEGNHRTTIPIPLGMFSAMEKALNANGGALRAIQERLIIHREIRNALYTTLSDTVAEEFWDF